MASDSSLLKAAERPPGVMGNRNCFLAAVSGIKGPILNPLLNHGVCELLAQENTENPTGSSSSSVFRLEERKILAGYSKEIKLFMSPKQDKNTPF